MKLMLFALRDNKAGSFRSLNMNESEILEKRNLAFAVNNDPHMLFIAKDLELYHIGDIETKTGYISALPVAEYICRCSDLVGAEKEVADEIR